MSGSLINGIPASVLVNVIPGVLGTGGQGVALNGLFLTTSWRVPTGSVYQFTSSSAVGAFFGLTSNEYAAAEVYFSGYTNCTQLPGVALFAQYEQAAVGAYLRGGAVSALTLTQLQAISGTLSVTINGSPVTGTPNLSAATGFSSAAGIIATALSLPVVTQATFTASIATTVLTVSAVASGTLAIGQTVVGTGVTGSPTITAFLTGTGGAGTYTISVSQSTISSESMTTTLPGCVYDSTSGAFVINSSTTGTSSTIGFATGTAAASLALTAATGAITSQGAAAATPAAFMTSTVAVTQNWATFTYLFNPDASGNTNKLAFATWAGLQNNRYALVAWDTDINATVAANTTNLGYLIQQAAIGATLLIYDPTNQHLAPFVMGYAASLNFGQAGGRTVLAYRGQSGLVPSVTLQQTAANLESYGYNFYGAYATAQSQFIFMQPGSISGVFLWADSFFNQIWLNSILQAALLELLSTVGTIPYNQTGYTYIRTTLIGTPQEPGPVEQAIAYGAIVPGGTLSSAQAVALQSQAGGINIAPTIASQGYYLLITAPSAAIQAARGTPVIILWYFDGESIQNISMSSIDVL